jgi:prepilin-type N-terminal cleavage/methylation domain-containing protein
VSPARRDRAGGFTLIELLVVVAIVALLAGMLMPALAVVKTAARTLRCQSCLRQVGMTVALYGSDHDGFLPYADYDPSALYPGRTQTYEIWMGQLYPWFDLGAESPSGANSALLRNRGNGRSVARGCPEWKDLGEFRHGYGLNYFPGYPALAATTARSGGVWMREIALHQLSHPSQRLLLGEAAGSLLAVTWNATVPTGFTAGDARRHAASRSNYVFADLHLQTVAATASPWLGLWNPATWQP